jgi:hypothetical protein
MKLASRWIAPALAAFLALPAAAADFDELLEGFAGSTEAEVRTYVQPLADAAALLSSSATFHSGRSKGIAGLDAGLRFVTLPFSGGDRGGILAESVGSLGSEATAASGLALPVLSLNKGLAKGFQVGGRFMALELSKDVGNLTLLGASLRYELNELFHVPLLMPRIGLQADWSRLSVGDHLETTATAVNLIVSKSFVMLEPYAGYTVGTASTDVAFTTRPEPPIQPQTWDVDLDSDISRLVLGLNFTPFPMLRLNAEVGLAETNSYGVGLLFNLF